MTPQEIFMDRCGLGLTQKEAADRIGITLRHYQRIESGQAVVTKTIAKLLDTHRKLKEAKERIARREPKSTFEYRLLDSFQEALYMFEHGQTDMAKKFAIELSLADARLVLNGIMKAYEEAPDKSST